MKGKKKIIEELKNHAVRLGFKPIGETNEIFIHKTEIVLKILDNTDKYSRYDELFRGV